MKPRMTTVVRTADNPELLQQLKSTLLNLELKRTELLTKYEPTYRLVQEVDQQIADAKSAISAEESKPIRDETTDQDPDYQWVRAELTKAQADLSGLKRACRRRGGHCSEVSRRTRSVSTKTWSCNRTSYRLPRHKRTIISYMNTSGKKRASATLLTSEAS